jgi:hypothetical protein
MPSAHLKLKIQKPTNSNPLSLPTVGQTATSEFDWLCFMKYWQAFWSENSLKAFRGPLALRNVDGNAGEVVVRDENSF